MYTTKQSLKQFFKWNGVYRNYAMKKEKQIFSLTPSARDRINNILTEKRIESDKAIIGIRVSTKSGGCNGLTYKMDFIEEIPKGDDIVKDNDITIAVDPRALLAVIGTEMDYITSPVKSEFIFNNPNAVSHCGCGESFSIEKPKSLYSEE